MKLDPGTFLPIPNKAVTINEPAGVNTKEHRLFPVDWMDVEQLAYASRGAFRVHHFGPPVDIVLTRRSCFSVFKVTEKGNGSISVEQVSRISFHMAVCLVPFFHMAVKVDTIG